MVWRRVAYLVVRERMDHGAQTAERHIDRLCLLPPETVRLGSLYALGASLGVGC